MAMSAEQFLQAMSSLLQQGQQPSYPPHGNPPNQLPPDPLARQQGGGQLPMQQANTTLADVRQTIDDCFVQLQMAIEDLPRRIAEEITAAQAKE